MKKIVIINQWASYLTKDIVNAFAEEYDKVELIAGTISETGNSLNDKVSITYITKYNKKNYVTRFFSWIIATIQVIILVNTKFRNYHLLLTSNPPTLSFVTLFCRNNYSVQVLDLYPDGLVAGRFISSESWIYRIWKRRNHKFFLKAKNVFTITEGMARSMSHYSDSGKINVIVQWPSSDGYTRIEREGNKFLNQHSLEKYFIIMYSGNIGLGHHVDILIEVAKLLMEHMDILFIIAGNGIARPGIERMIDEYDLQNCRLFPYQEPGMFMHSLQAAHIGVVSISKEGAQLCVPIKAYNLINSRLPLLCITDDGSELSVMVSKYDIGKCFRPDQINDMAEYILSLKNDVSKYGDYKNNLESCAPNFSSENAYNYVTKFNY